MARRYTQKLRREKKTRPKCRFETRRSFTASNQVFIESVNVGIDCHYALYGMTVQGNPGQGAGKFRTVAGHYQQSQTVIMQFNLGNMVLYEQ